MKLKRGECVCHSKQQQTLCLPTKNRRLVKENSGQLTGAALCALLWPPNRGNLLVVPVSGKRQPFFKMCVSLTPHMQNENQSLVKLTFDVLFLCLLLHLKSCFFKFFYFFY